MQKLRKPPVFPYSHSKASVCAYLGETEGEKKDVNTVAAPSDSSRSTPDFWEEPVEHMTQGLDSPGTIAAIGVSTVAGAITGARTGAAIGTAIAPGTGTVIGGVYGAAAGAWVGMARAGGVAVGYNCVGCHVIRPLAK